MGGRRGIAEQARCRMLYFVLFVLVASSLCAVPAQERTDLENLYYATGGATWYDNTNWLVGDPCETGWYGVSCSSNTTITGLLLSANNLTGLLSPLHLPSLVDL